MAKQKQPTSFRLSEHAHALINRLAEAMGLSRTAVLEQAIRALARREGVELDSPPRRRPRRDKS